MPQQEQPLDLAGGKRPAEQEALHLRASFGRNPGVVAERTCRFSFEDDNPKRQMIDRLFEPLTQVSWLGMDGTRS